MKALIALWNEAAGMALQEKHGDRQDRDDPEYP